jgi:hypothetical protein
MPGDKCSRGRIYTVGKVCEMNLSLTTDPSTNRRFVLLSPPGMPAKSPFRNIEVDTSRRKELLTDMQRLRGRIYWQDGAITAKDLAADGRHVQPADEESWHLLLLNPSNQVVGCTRYVLHSASTSFNGLHVRDAALARSGQWSGPLRRAVEQEMETARQRGLTYIEVGGWALDESVRGSADALRSVLFTYAWSQVIGGCMGLSTATHRNGSASILRRIGGRPLEWDGQELPPYYDPQFKCDMEVIRFDSYDSSTKYRHAIDEMKWQIPSMPVIAGKSSNPWNAFVNLLQRPASALAEWPAFNSGLAAASHTDATV